MQYYTIHGILFLITALLSCLAVRVSSEYLRMCLPGFLFGLCFGALHLATLGRTLVFAVLAGAGYFAAHYIAMRTVRFKEASKKSTPHRQMQTPPPLDCDHQDSQPESHSAPLTETVTKVYDARSTSELFGAVIAEMIKESQRDFGFEPRSLALAGAIAGFVGSLSLALGMTLLDSTFLGTWDYCRTVTIGTLAGIVFMFSRTYGLGYLIWQASVGIALATPFTNRAQASTELRLAFYGGKAVALWQVIHRALGGNVYEFLFGTSALQNYLSELIGILIAVVVVDRIIRYRTDQRERPRRDMACVLAFELLDSFIARYLPDPYRSNGARSQRFGNYHASSGVYRFHEVVLSWAAVSSEIVSAERRRWERINWPESTGVTEEARMAEEITLKTSLHDVRQYGKELGDFVLQHQAVLDEELLQRLSEIRFTIATAFAAYYEPLKPTYDRAFGVDIETLLPTVLLQTIDLTLYLERTYEQEQGGGIRD